MINLTSGQIGGRRRGLRVLGLASISAAMLASTELGAADQWIEVKTANFTVVSNAGDRSARKLAWQLEQVRSAMRALWSWAKPDLIKPLSVIVARTKSACARSRRSIGRIARACVLRASG